MQEQQDQKEDALRRMSTSPLGHRHREPSPSLPGSASNPVRIPPEPDYDVVSINSDHPHEEQLSDFEPSTYSTPPLNGHAAHADERASSAATVPYSPPSSSRPQAFPTSPVDMAMRSASRNLAPDVPTKNTISDVDRSPLLRAPGTFPDTAEQKEKEAENTKKRQNVIVRTLWTLIMISGFLGKFAYLSTVNLIPSLYMS